MSFKVKGRIAVVLPKQEGTSAKGAWTKSDFVLETDEQYSKNICFSLFNKPLNFGIGANVEVDFSVESREYNEKWFTNVNAFKVELIGVQPKEPEHFDSRTPTGDSDEKDDLPF